MNKVLSSSEIDVPPLLMLVLATISLVFNLCFPQYAAYANMETQEFTKEDGLKENVVALKRLQKEIEDKKIAENQQNTQKAEVYAELTVEKKKAIKKTAKVASAKTQSSANTVTTPSNGVSSRWVTVTAYSSTVDQCDSSPFITASGTHVRDGVIATNLLAFGTKVKFPSIYGDKIFVVEDRMNARYTNRADIWFATREEAKRFGVKKLEMVIVS